MTHDIQRSMSRVGNPHDNAKAESFMKTLKQEEISGSSYRNLRQARSAIGAFIETVYNRQRLHSALACRSPDEYETALGRVSEVTSPPEVSVTENCYFRVSTPGCTPDRVAMVRGRTKPVVAFPYRVASPAGIVEQLRSCSRLRRQLLRQANKRCERGRHATEAHEQTPPAGEKRDQLRCHSSPRSAKHFSWGSPSLRLPPDCNKQ